MATRIERDSGRSHEGREEGDLAVGDEETLTPDGGFVRLDLPGTEPGENEVGEE
jgi:hypothetical protein